MHKFASLLTAGQNASVRVLSLKKKRHQQKVSMQLIVEQEVPPPTGSGPPRVMRKTLSRKSPFLPEVLPATIDYNDIVFCEEDGRKVLLGEGSFGQVGSCHLCCSTPFRLFKMPLLGLACSVVFDVS